MVLVKPVSSKSDLGKFVDFPHELFKHDAHYVPELFIAQRDLLTPSHHPFFKHSSLQLFLAYNGEKVVGRIAAIQNNNHNAFNASNDGFFGFFDTIDDYEVAQALLETAVNWLKQKGFTTVLGPVNFSTNEPCGLLVEGFDRPPVVMMPYNPDYYSELLEKFGFLKKVDLFAYLIESHDFNDKSVRLLEAFEERLKNKGITIRQVNLKKFKQEVESLKQVYNAAWDKNLGFVPMTDEEFTYQANDLKLILDPEFCLIAEKEGKVIGFALCIPNINEILIKIKRGRLLPFGIFKLLTQRKSIRSLRVLALGVLEDYRKLGVEACFYGKIIQSGKKKNYQWAEASWVLENNVMMNNAVANINGKPYKRYRIYGKAI